jgi:hypothetical protein
MNVNLITLRHRLRIAGYSPIPCEGKKPSMDKWQEQLSATPDEIRLWSGLFPYATNTGVLTRLVPTIDIDILNPEAAKAVEDLVSERHAEHGNILVRFGLPPKRAIPFRTDEPFKKIAVNLIAADGSEGQKIELLADGQQFVVAGIHPDTRKPYAWFGGILDETPREELPYIRENEARALVEAAAELLVRDFGYTRAQARPKDRANANGHADPGGSADWQYLFDNIRDGHALHDSLRDLAAKLIASGTGAGAAVNQLRALMGSSSAIRDPRWRERYDDIPRLVESARGSSKSTPLPEPIDLWAQFEPPELPHGVLPPIIETFARQRAEITGADPAGLALGALTVCGAAIPDRIKLQVKKHDQGWKEAARLWAALIGLPATKKTPIMQEVTWPLKRLDAKMLQKYAQEKAIYDDLTKEERRQTQPPKQERLRIEDTTIEAAQEVLKDSPEGVLCSQDELAGWFAGMDKYSAGRGAGRDRAFWLQAYNGGTYALNRIGRGVALIPNLSISVLGGIQPEPVRQVVEDTVDDGLIQRLIPLLLQPGTESKDVEPTAVVTQYAALIEKLRNNSSKSELLLRFDTGAHAVRQRLERKHLNLAISCERINRKLAAHLGKYDGIFVRLCLIFHCIEHAEEGTIFPVSEDIALRVERLLHEFLFPHAVAFYVNMLGFADDQDRLTAVAGYILAHKLNEITNRDIARSVRTMRRLTRADTTAVFEQLEALGWLMRSPAPRPTDPPHWKVNPKCHENFAERAQREAARREQDREMLAALFAQQRTK